MKSFRATASQGSQVLVVDEDVRNLLDAGQEVFVNRVAYATHRTRAPKQWERKTVELDRAFAEPSDKNAELSFLPKLKPKSKLKPISLDTKLQKETELQLSVDSLTIEPVSGATGSANSLAENGNLSDSLAMPPNSPRNNNAGSTPGQPSPSNASRQSEQRSFAASSSSSVAASAAGSESVLEAQRRAQARVLRKLAEEKQALERKDAAEAEEMRLRIEKNELKVRTMAERTMERVNDFLTRKQQQEEAAQRQLEATAVHLAESNAKVHTDSYKNKLRDLRADANQRMRRFQDVRLRSLQDDEKQHAEALAAARQRRGAETTFRPKRRAGGVVYVHNVDENCDYLEEPGASGRQRVQPVLHDLDTLEAAHHTAAPRPGIHRQRSQSERDRRRPVPPPAAPPAEEDVDPRDAAAEESLLEYIDRNEQPPRDLDRFLTDDRVAEGGVDSHGTCAPRPATIHSVSLASDASAAAHREAYLAAAAPLARVAFRPQPPTDSPPPPRHVDKGDKGDKNNPDALFATSHHSPVDRYLRGGTGGNQGMGEDDGNASDSSDLSDITVDHQPLASRGTLPQATAPRSLPRRREADVVRGALPPLGAPSSRLPSLDGSQMSPQSAQKAKAKRSFKRLAPIPIAPYQPVPPR